MRSTTFPLFRVLSAGPARGGAMRCVLAALGLMAATMPAVARVGGPVQRISLESLDYQPLPSVVLSSGVALLSLDYVDADHLLVTFNRRRLLPRIPGDPPTDVDRNIDAVLVDAGTGKPVARANWRMHDAGRYLWPLGHGEFLLRDRDRLLTFAPVEGLAHGDAFKLHEMVNSRRPISAVLLSPTADLLVLETRDRLPEPAKPQSLGGLLHRAGVTAGAAGSAGEQAAETSEGLVQVDFLRLLPGGAVGATKALAAGTVAARTAVYLPVDSAGWLTAVDQGRAHWAFDFHRHDGKVDELSPFDTTCRPQAELVSRSEFIAFGCRGGDDRREIGGFNLRGEEMWEQTFQESTLSPEVVSAPEGGRFALSRLTTDSPVVAGGDPLSTAITGQVVTVFQTESGKQVFQVSPTPVMRTGQNFALSPDGTHLAVINAGAVEIYALPGLTSQDRARMKMAEGLVPPADAKLPILMGASGMRPATEGEVDRSAPEMKSAVAVRAAEAPAAAETSAEKKTEEHTVALGDPVVDAERPRKAPTLLSPDEAEKKDAGR